MYTAPTSPTPKRAAFTLIELLTVIAIIGVLAAILIPAIGAVRQNANEAKGLNNLRQIGVAISMFCTEHSNKFPPAVTQNSDYARILAPYFGAEGSTWADVSEGERSEVFKDPSADYQAGVYHFGANPNFMGDLQQWNETDPRPDDIARMVSRLSAQRPGQQILLADACQMNGGNPHATLYSVSGIWNNYSGGSSAPVARGSDQDGAGGHLRWRAAGGDGVKCLFIDGHVSVMQEGELLQKHFQRDIRSIDTHGTSTDTSIHLGSARDAPGYTELIQAALL
jgi:prepilin-type N-terminal cleavage/methylation domain-containing protein